MIYLRLTNGRTEVIEARHYGQTIFTVAIDYDDKRVMWSKEHQRWQLMASGEWIDKIEITS